jgi:4-amino-4-deoxy-L-arabinose transferase-like glycosyltransferase
MPDAGAGALSSLFYMSDTKTSEPAKVASSAAKNGTILASLSGARQALTIGGVVIGGVNVIASALGVFKSADKTLPAVLWAVAAACFLGSFILYLLHPSRAEAEAASTTARGAPSRDAEAPATHYAREPGEASTTATVEEDDADVPSEKEEGPLVPKGNPLRVLRGGVTTLAASFIAFILMAHHGQLRWGVPAGFVFVAIASWGVMDFVGSFDDPDDRVELSQSLLSLAGPLTRWLVASLAFCLFLGLGVAGRGLPPVGWGLLITTAFIGFVATTFQLGRALGAWAQDEDGKDRPLWRRHGFWLVAGAAALYMPFMGAYALWDPWETHYGEVAREMLARDDWISLWWAQDGWFWSKPVLDMWMQAIAMATLGVHYQPDKMLIGDGTQPVMHPEWAVRAPVILLTILGLYLLYKGVARTYGRRAAFLGALVLGTMPDWFLIAHQTMTDMPFVGAMTACMGLVLVGLRTDGHAQARVYEVTVGPTRWRLSAWHLVFGAVLVSVLPQLLYLLSRNVELVWRPGAHGFHMHWDEFRSGSGGGNCGLPGNEECRSTLPASIPHSTGPNPETFGASVWRTVGAFEPVIQALVWAAALGVLLYMSWGERRLRRLYYLAAWYFAALSTLAKGPAGFGLPVLVVLLYLLASKPSEGFFARLRRIVRELTQFEIVAGLVLMIPVVALPWYVAMYVRHGAPFTDRLIFHDMFNRAFHHVHDTNEGDDTSFRFYVWQLGYALFPWTGLAPVGLLWWLRRGDARQDNRRADTGVLLCMWFLVGFALFSFMGTKFHHYILPAVPPVGMLIGVVLDDMLGDRKLAAKGSLPTYLVGITAGVALATFGIARTQAGSFFGTKPDGRLADPSVVVGVIIAVVGAAAVYLAVRFFGCKDEKEPGAVDDDAGAHRSRMLAGGSAAAAFLLVLVSRDLIIKPDNADQPGAIRLLHLYTYNYRRPWPDSLDFSAALTGFGVVAVLVCLALAVRAIRPHVVAAACAFACVWTLWGLDVYLNETAPHWGQHEVIAAYYADRASPDELLVAYQMNWKGENFYTGNRIPAFVSSGSTFTSWLKQKRDQGMKVMYFITEHGRIGGLKGEVGAKAYREITDKTLCNKFVLVRAEL